MFSRWMMNFESLHIFRTYQNANAPLSIKVDQNKICSKATQYNMCVLGQLARTFLFNLSKIKHKIWLAFYLLFIVKTLNLPSKDFLNI